MIWHSLRVRLQLWHGLILTCVIAGFGFTAYRLARADRLRQIDDQLNVRVSALASALRAESMKDRPGPGGPRGGPDRERFRPDQPPFGPEWGPGPGPHHDPQDPPPGRLPFPAPDLSGLFDQQSNSFYYVVWLRDGSAQMRSTNAPADVPVPDRLDVVGLRPAEMRGGFRECAQVSAIGRSIVVGRSIGPELADLGRQAWWLALAGVSVLVVGLAGGWWVATRAIRPIEDIGTTAARIAAGDLSQRIPVGNTVDELSRVAEVLNGTFARLESVFAQQARFTADAAHELRTPVTVLLTHAQNGLACECPTAEHREAFEACQRAAQRMRRLIESLLRLSRLEAGQDRLLQERFDLAETVREGIELIRPLAVDRGLTLRVELVPTLCLGDAGSIGQVVTNLLANAVQFNRPGGEIRVEVGSHACAARLVVSDTGPGIAPEDLPRVFERFHRGDRSRSRQSGGTGLGLAISKAIVEAHHGVIAVASTPGAGASFTVRLPLVPA